MTGVVSPFASMPAPTCGARVEEWRAAIVALPVQMRAELAELFKPYALRSAWIAQRDDLLCLMAVGRNGDTKALAEIVATDLLRYATSAWSFDRHRAEPHNRAHSLAHQVLRLTNGAVPAAATIRKIFGQRLSRAVRKNSRGNEHAIAK